MCDRDSRGYWLVKVLSQLLFYLTYINNHKNSFVTIRSMNKNIINIYMFAKDFQFLDHLVI